MYNTCMHACMHPSITLHCITLHYSTSHHITLHYITYHTYILYSPFWANLTWWEGQRRLGYSLHTAAGWSTTGRLGSEDA